MAGENLNCWMVYVVECSDGTLYTGCTTDLTRRLAEHNGCDRKGAKYTRSRRPVKLMYSELHDSRASAARRESAIKRLPRRKKLTLCNGNAEES